MMTLTARPYAGEVDLQPLADFLNACEAVDQLDYYTTVNELRLELNDPLVDNPRDVRIWTEASGDILAFAQIWIPCPTAEQDGWLAFRVHPKCRNQGLEQDILTWSKQRMKELMQERQLPVKLRSGTRSDQSDRISFLEKSGFTCDRQFLTMVKSLIPPIPEAKLPEGFTIQTASGRNQAELWVEMYNQTFIDHWGFHPFSVKELLHEIENDLYYRPELDLVAIAPDGTYAAFCWAYINPEANTQRNCNEGWVNSLGVRRGFRRMGLGRAMLLAGMQALWEAGVDTVKLGVDTQNPNHALHLYESVGFRKLHSRLTYFLAI